MVLALTELLVADASPTQQDRLFLTRSIYTVSSRRSLRSRTEVVEHSVLRRAILRFTTRANHRIDEWNAAHPDSLRRGSPASRPLCFGDVATAHYQPPAAIFCNQSILNHASAATTETYLKSEGDDALQRQTIARLQNLMVAWVRGLNDHPTRAAATISGTLRSVMIALPPSYQAMTAMVACARILGGCPSCPGLVIPTTRNIWHASASATGGIVSIAESAACMGDERGPNRCGAPRVPA